MDPIEQVRQEQERRWRETLELLGLDPSSPMPSTQAAAPAPAPKPAPLPPRVDPVPVVERKPAPRVQPPLVEAEIVEDVAGEMDSSEPTGEAPKHAGATPAEDAEERAGRGRRRRRRGGRSARTGEEAPAEEGTPTPDAESPEAAAPAAGGKETTEEEENGGRRRRGRSRRKKAPVPAEAAVNGEADDEAPTPIDEEPEETPAAMDDDADPDADNLSDWNVPAWNDLIAALYRPER